MYFLLGVVLEVIFVIFFSLLGMASVPNVMDKSQDESRKISAFLFSPMIGFAIWLAFTCCLGMFLPYNRIFLLGMFIIAVIFIYYKREKLYLPNNKGMWGFILVVLVISAFIIFAVLPLTTNDGIYFSMSAADNTRVCLVNSIVREGLPPINPYLTYNGDLLPAYYHFGIFAFAAQPSIVLGVNSIVASAMTNGLAISFLMFIAGAICYRFIYSNKAFIFVSIFYMISAPHTVLERILPLSLQEVLYPHESFIGFFPLIGEVTFSPHSCTASALIILMIYLYAECIGTEDKKDRYHYAILIGLTAVASFYNSAYVGFLSAAILGLTAVILFCLRKEFRVLIRNSLIQHIVILIVALVFSIAYIRYLFLIPGSSEGGIVLGFLPAYGDISGLGIIGAILDFYLFLLPSNVGIFMLFALAAIFIPKVLPDAHFTRIVRTFIGIVLVSIFIVHSAALTNDYGWRMTEIPYIIGIITAVFICCKLFDYLSEKNRFYGYILIISCFLLVFAIGQEIVATTVHTKVPGDSNKVFKEAVEGWKVVREYTDADDIVMSNPEDFADVSLRNESNNYQGVNYFSAYYADRYIVINDLLTTKTSFVGPQTFEEIDDLYNRMVNIFAGNVSEEDVEFLATEQKVKALLVLAQDGLYSDEGALGKKYDLVDENRNYKVYVLR